MECQELRVKMKKQIENDLSHDFEENEEKESVEEAIYLMFNISFGHKTCCFHNKNFEFWLPLRFFLNVNPAQPLAPSEALKRGFVMREEDFINPANQIDMYRSMTRGKYQPSKISSSNIER
jgi:hypothetical protein